MYFPDRGCVRHLRHLYGYATAVHAIQCGLYPPVLYRFDEYVGRFRLSSAYTSITTMC